MRVKYVTLRTVIYVGNQERSEYRSINALKGEVYVDDGSEAGIK